MDPRRRVEVGMAVRDADGKKLGKVCRLDPWGFEVVRGFWGPREWVIRYAEVLRVEGGAVQVARSDEALFELASGGLPHAWRRYRLPLATSSLPSAPADGEVEGALVDFFLDEAGEEAISRTSGTPAVEPVPVSAHCYTPPLATTTSPPAPADKETEEALLDFLLDEPGKKAISRRSGAPTAVPASTQGHS